MIKIGKPYVTREGDRAVLRAPVMIPKEAGERYRKAVEPKRHLLVWLTDEDYPPAAWDSDDSNLWYDVPAEFEKYLCAERSNTFVTGLFWYAMLTGEDICFEAPMSARLYRGFTEMVMPELEKAGFSPVKLSGPVTDEPVWCEGGVVCGMSGGVDSFYSLKCYEGDDAPDGLKLTHLSHYTCSYLFKPLEMEKGLDAQYADEDAIEEIILDRAGKIAAAHGLPFVDVNTNLDRDYYRGGYTYMAMYRYLSCTLALEHLYRTYISSSSGHENGMMEVSLFAPTQHYEELLVNALQTETFRYVSSDNVPRPEKLRAIGDDPLFRRYVSVCFDTGRHGENCGACYGCWKTMIPLDILGKLKGFSESFDLDRYYSNRKGVFEDFINFSERPEATSARRTLSQVTALAEKEKSDAGREFLEVREEYVSRDHNH